MGKRQTARHQRRKAPDFRVPGHGQAATAARHQAPASARRDRRGLRQLAAHEEPGTRFAAEEPSFAEAFETTVSSDAFRTALAEKNDRLAPASGRAAAAAITRYPTPENQLDLHGCTAAEAEMRVAAFVRAGRGKGLLTLRIITGKGRHSAGNRPVLPDVVERLLLDLKREGIVLAFHWEKKEKHKSGALLVFLP